MKNVFILLLLVIVISCAGDSETEVTKPDNTVIVDKVTPTKLKIGDTITITGSNLDKVNIIGFMHKNNKYINYDLRIESPYFISKTSDKIKVLVPKMYHENISMGVGTRETELNLVGFIPVLNGLPFGNSIKQIKILDDNTAFLLTENKIYKSSDGFYTWNLVYQLDNGYLNSFDCLDQLHFWIGISKNTGVPSIHYSEDGGNTFKLKFQLENNMYVKKIQFTSLTKGFFVDSNQMMYVIENNSFKNVFDYYPELGLSSGGKFEIYSFQAINENLIALQPNSYNFSKIVMIDKQKITFSESFSPNNAVYYFRFLGSNGFVTAGLSLFSSNDLGNSWTKVIEFDKDFQGVNFFSSKIGFVYKLDKNGYQLYMTKDGGLSWKKQVYMSNVQVGYGETAFNENVGIQANSGGLIWKYIKE
jgi:hypothetical protein